MVMSNVLLLSFFKWQLLKFKHWFASMCMSSEYGVKQPSVKAIAATRNTTQGQRDCVLMLFFISLYRLGRDMFI